MESIEKYKQISDVYNNSITRGISRQIVIDEKQEPKTVGIWGRFTRYMSSLRISQQQLQNIYEIAINNFKEAIAQTYSADARDDAYQILTEVASKNRSLRARDVHIALGAADKVQAAQEEKEQIEEQAKQNAIDLGNLAQPDHDKKELIEEHASKNPVDQADKVQAAQEEKEQIEEHTSKNPVDQADKVQAAQEEKEQIEEQAKQNAIDLGNLAQPDHDKREQIEEHASKNPVDQADKVQAAQEEKEQIEALARQNAIDIANQARAAQDEKEQIEALARQKISGPMAFLLGEKVANICRAYLARPEMTNIAPGVFLTPDENTALLVCTGTVCGEGLILNTIQIGGSENNAESEEPKIEKPKKDEPLIMGLKSALAKIRESKQDDNQLDEFICVARETEIGFNIEDFLSAVPTWPVYDYQTLDIYDSDTDYRYLEDRKDHRKTIERYKTSTGVAVNIPQENGPAKRFLILSPDTMFTTAISSNYDGQDEQNSTTLLRGTEDSGKGAIICNFTEGKKIS